MDRLGALMAASPSRFATALAGAVREVARRSPAPRDLPFFGLDHPAGARPAALERLSDLGIFRFYEHVLDLGGGLGGPARWLARRRGCRVVLWERDPGRSAAARLLARRAHLETQVTIVSAAAELPFREAAFTHAWGVDAFADRADPAPVCREVYRAVRPGGLVALQEWARPMGVAADPAGRWLGTDVLLDALAAAGFTEPRAEPADMVPQADSAIADVVAARARELFGEPTGDEREVVARTESCLADRRRAVAEGHLSLVRVFARKPA